MHNHNNNIPPPPPMGLSLHTSFPSPSPNSYARSDYSTHSPLSSSATTSPTSSSSSPFRRLCRSAATGGWNWGNNHNAFPPTSDYSSSPSSRSRSQSPFRFASTLRRSSLALLLRRRPSKIDLALSEERSRAGEDSIERQGLGLMEPRPVDPMMMGIGGNVAVTGPVAVGGDQRSSMQSLSISKPAQPTFVMGGIEEVLEGKA